MSSRLPSLSRVLDLLPWLAAAVVVATLLRVGVPAGDDFSLELVRIAEYGHAVADGQLPPHWAPDLYGGWGSPIFVSYAPLFLALASVAATLTGGPFGGAVLALVALILAGTGAGIVLGRAAAPGVPGAARVTAMALVTAPYLLCNVFLRNANAEAAALLLAPLALAGVAWLRRAPRPGAALLAAGLALTVLAHNLTALSVTAIVVIGGSCWLVLERRGPACWIALAGGSALGLALSAFFWWPALRLVDLVRTGELTGGRFRYARHFADPATLADGAAPFAPGPVPFLLLLLAAAVAMWALARRSRRGPPLALAVAGACGFVVLATPAAAPLWSAFAPLALWQFPWRMLGPAGVLAALALGLAVAELGAGRGPAVRRGLELAMLVACLAAAAPKLGAARPIPIEPARRLAERLDAAGIRAAGLYATAGDEYVPAGAAADAWRRRLRRDGAVLSLEPPGRLDVEATAGSRLVATLPDAAGGRLALARWAYPGWRATGDGTPLSTGTGPDGELTVQVPPGVVRVTIERAAPFARRAAAVVSAAAVLAWIALVAAAARARRSP